MDKNKKQNKGFSLVELVIVVAIMAILVGILAPQYIKYVERSRKSADASNADNFATAVKVANADGKYTIPAATYTITISKDNGTTVTVADKADTSLNDAFDEYVGSNWAKTTLKSSKWDAANAKSPVKVTCVVADNGSVTVTYSPETVSNFLKED